MFSNLSGPTLKDAEMKEPRTNCSLDTMAAVSSDWAMVKGVARVVEVDGDVVWLEPEQTTSCGVCVSGPSCGVKGIGSIASRLQARRFRLDKPAGDLAVGERVLVGIRDSALIKATMTAYAIPLAFALGAGCFVQWLAASDGLTMLAIFAGLAIGLMAARYCAGILQSRGELAPRFLGRAGAGGDLRLRLGKR